VFASSVSGHRFNDVETWFFRQPLNRRWGQRLYRSAEALRHPNLIRELRFATIRGPRALQLLQQALAIPFIVVSGIGEQAAVAVV
jgi:hypothetical protein